MEPDIFGLEALRAQPGFGGYAPSYSAVDQVPMVNEDVIINNDYNVGGIELPTPREFGQNFIKQQAINYLGKKFGLPAVATNILGSNMLTGNALGMTPFAPLAMMGPGLASLNTRAQSSLFGRSATMSDYLAAKREQKAAQTLERQMQTAVADQEKAMAQRAISGGQGQSIPDRNRGQVATSSGFSSKERGAALHG
jgi:hypothetical protein